MSLKDKPEGGVLVPLSRGSVRPVDARKFAGVRLEMRGAGRYLLVVNTLAGEFTAPIDAKEGWSELRVPFTALVATKPGRGDAPSWRGDDLVQVRSEEHTSELQSLMRISYAVFCLKKKKKHRENRTAQRKQ